MRRSLAILVAILGCAAGAEGRARADEDTIAVLPLSSSGKRLQMYGVPVSRVLATELRAAVGAGVQVQEVALSGSAALPREVAWVIDGRIVERGRNKVVIEARLRDPGRGSAFGQVATEPAALSDIDRLAREAALELVPVLARARAERAERERARTPSPSPSPNPTPNPSPITSTTTRPTIVITPDREPIVTDAMKALVARLGYEPIVGELRGIAAPDKVRTELARTGGAFVLLHEVESVDYEWDGVLTARGAIRLVLVDPAGRPVYDRVLETDTLVGSRGDRHAALLGFVARQAMDMAATRMRKVLLPVTRALLVVAALLLLAPAAHAQRAAPDVLVEASAALGAGDHRRALLLAGPVARAPGPAADRAEAWRIVAVAQFYLGQRDAARQAFLACLLLDPDANLDPALHPPEVVNLLAEVRRDHAAEIAAARPTPRRRRSGWLSFVPVVAQWQNGDTTKMWVFASLGTALLAANVTSYVLLRRWCDPSDGTCDENLPGEEGYSDHLPEARRARIVNVGSAVGLATVLVIAVVDGRLGYQRLVREEAEPQPRFGVAADGNTLSVTVGGSF